MMNSLVHVFMYGYYAWRSLNLPMARWIAMTLTSLQIAQMAAGCLVGCSVMFIKLTQPERPCQHTWENLALAFLIYTSYGVLFVRFFHQAYLARCEKRHAKEPVQKQRVKTANNESKED